MNLLICALCYILVFYEANASQVGVPDGGPRIVGGAAANLNNTRHQVSIRLLAYDQNNFGQGHICGGSLISNNTVLTAAHCLFDQSNKIRKAADFRVVGGHLIRTNQDSNTHVSTVTTIRYHRNYRPDTFENDIAIMILSTPVPVTHPTFRPIPLLTSRKPDNTSCEISGWGTIAYEGASSLVLLAANVSLISTNICNGPNSYQNAVKKGMMCAGSMAGGVDACQGDSGGPLVCNGQLTGVTSNGYRCAEPNYPGIYVDLMEYQDWIKENSSNQLCTSLFIVVALFQIWFKF